MFILKETVVTKVKKFLQGFQSTPNALALAGITQSSGCEGGCAGTCAGGCASGCGGSAS